MLIARVIQGAGGGALQPLSQAILLESFPPAKRGAAMAVFAFGVVVAPVLGPTLGGWLTDTYSWRYAFYINIPIGILALFMISRFVHDPPYIKDRRSPLFDTLRLRPLSSSGPAASRSSSTRARKSTGSAPSGSAGPPSSSSSPSSASSGTPGRDKDPLVDLKVLKDRNFLIGCTLIFLFGIAIYSTVTVLPLFYQELLGYTAFTAGLVVAPRGLGAICGMPIIGYLSNKVDPRYLLTFGFFTFGLTTLYFGAITLDISPTTLLLPILITGFGLSFVFVPINTAAYGTLRNEQIGNASGLFNLMRNVGGSIGISLAHNAARPPRRRPPERDRQLTSRRPASTSRTALAQRHRTSSPATSAPPTPLQPPRPASTGNSSARPQLGLRRRLPLALAAQLRLHRRRLVLQEGEARPRPRRRPLTLSSLFGGNTGISDPLVRPA